MAVEKPGELADLEDAVHLEAVLLVVEAIRRVAALLRGVDDPDIPVLPEFMVLKIEEAAFFGTKRSKWTEGQSRSATSGTATAIE